MTHLDLFYRAFTEYKKHTVTNIDCVRFSRASQALNKSDNESLYLTIASCTIDEDWVKAIEEGIPFILKAIKEERQFIRTDGEVTPIEKVRKTNKDSVQDLAKHSNYISHEAPDNINADILPDKVLIVKKENDYTVYENRVVYALLVYLEQFVSMRYNAIKETMNKYDSKLNINKVIISGNRNVAVKLTLNEVNKEDPIAVKRNKYQNLLDRISLIYSNILVLIKTPLMQECSKVDIVSQPITKTNVLRMNRNFKACVALFDFILEYQKPGYTINITKKNFAPFNKELESDYAELIMLATFITYIHTNGITKELKANYESENERLKKLEEEALLEKVNKLEKKAKLEGKELNEYIALVSEANKILEAKTKELNLKIEQLKENQKQEIENIESQHQHEISVIKEENDTKISEINANHEQNIHELTKKHQNEIQSINDNHQQEVNHLTETYEAKIIELNREISIANSEKEKAILDAENHIKENDKQFNDMKEQLIYQTNQQIKSANDAKEHAEAELLAIRLKDGLVANPEDFSSLERFNDLEKEKEYIDTLFKAAWKASKKQIRKKVMSVKPEKLFNKKEKVKEEAKEEIKEKEVDSK